MFLIFITTTVRISNVANEKGLKGGLSMPHGISKKNAENVVRAYHNMTEMVCDGLDWIQLAQNKIFSWYLWV